MGEDLLFRIPGMILICLGLAACAQGRAYYKPAANPQLAQQGWVERSDFPAFRSSGGVTNRHILMCKGASCGGPGFMGTASYPLPPGQAAMFHLMISNPAVTNAKLRTTMEVVGESSPLFVLAHGRVDDARKERGKLILTVSSDKSLFTGENLYSVGRAVINGQTAEIAAGSGTTPAKAQERLRQAERGL